MLNAVTDRLARVRTVLTRATILPLLVRVGIVVSGSVAVGLAYPAAIVASGVLLVLLVVAVVPAFLPRGRAATVAVVMVVAGWILDTTWYDEPVALWRVLALATLLYLGHTLTALAAVLPYDARVRVDVVVFWLGRAGAVILASAVLTIIVLALAVRLEGPTFLAATLVGLAAAVGAAVLLTRLLRRS